MKSLFHCFKFLLGLEGPYSQVTDKELFLLEKYARNAEVIVEIGCYEGKTSTALAQNCSGVVYTIDHFPKGRLGICYGEWIAQIHCRRKKVLNVRFLKGLSHVVVQEFSEAIDFLFVDGDHTFEGLKKDWEDWFPKVRDGGIIGLHDCKQAANSRNYLGSMRFYSHDIPKICQVKEVDSVDSLVIFRVGL